MTFIPIVPFVQRSDQDISRMKPGWLKLEADEIFVRAYGGGPKKHVLSKVLTLLGTVILGLAIFFATMYRGSLMANGLGPGAIQWIIFGVLVMNVIVVVILAATKARQAAYLTTKMLIVHGPKGYFGINLAEITTLRPLEGRLAVFTRGKHEPVAALTVSDLAQATAELAAYCQSAGAKLQ
ncbi:hypothetical protein JW859_11120 [bacterium]|nr:hypothetical protein [bacterium]